MVVLAEKQIEMNFMEQLQGDAPQIMGMDYYNVIITAASALILCMAFVYLTAEDEAIQSMVFVHGGLCIGMICIVVWYRNKIHEQS